jgi:membrane associated rhomboid family serine protease
MIPLKDNLLFFARPTITTLPILLNCVFFVVETALLQSGSYYAGLVQQFAMFTPANFTHAFASGDPLAMLLTTCTLFTAMFLHAGFMHIFGNMVFLNCFGRAVEARLGKRQYIAFYLLAGLAATAGQYFMNPLSEAPNLGASGAIAGVLSAYLMFWPRARIAGLSVQLGVIWAPAWSFLTTWVGTQVLSMLFEHFGTASSGGGGVAYMAHIGGFAFGILAAYTARWLKPVHNVSYPDDVARPKKKKKRSASRVAGALNLLWRKSGALVSRLRPRKSEPVSEHGGQS